MKLSSKDLRLLQQAADVAEAQQELIRLAKSAEEENWMAAALAASAAAIVLLIFVFSMTPAPGETAEWASSPQQVALLGERAPYGNR